MTHMTLNEAVKRACKEPTLLEALTFICVWECARAVNQANIGSYDTCFKVSLKAVMDAYEEVE